MINYSVILFNNDGFDGLRRPRHILAERLSRMGHPVLFISFAVTHFTQRAKYRSLRFGGLKKIASMFYWYQPPSFLPSSEREFFGKMTALARQVLLKLIIGFTSKANRVFFISFPDEDSMSVLRKQTGVPVIYNVHDRLVDTRGVWVDGHEELLRRADIILCGSQLLVAEIKAGTDKPVHYFPRVLILRFSPEAWSFRNLGRLKRWLSDSSEIWERRLTGPCCVRLPPS